MSSTEVLIFCTLFDSNYLDKGLTLYYSMIRRIKYFNIYIYAFDDISYQILTKMRLERAIIIPLEQIMDSKLEAIRKERTRAEFCWTCTPIVIEKTLLTYGEKICTYIDADIYFFSDPQKLIQEILDNNCSVGIVEHRFEKNRDYYKNIMQNGKYCVQFNTFMNDKAGMEVLADWKEKCLKWCYNRLENGKMGDQKYLDNWKKTYPFVHELQDLGGGVAPWNLHLYEIVEKEDGDIWLRYEQKEFELVFYHFEGMKYLNDQKVFLNLWSTMKPGMYQKVDKIYRLYFKDIGYIRKILKKEYNINFKNLILEKQDQKKILSNFFLLNSIFNEGVVKGYLAWLSNRKVNIYVEKGKKACLYRTK